MRVWSASGIGIIAFVFTFSIIGRHFFNCQKSRNYIYSWQLEIIMISSPLSHSYYLLAPPNLMILESCKSFWMFLKVNVKSWTTGFLINSTVWLLIMSISGLGFESWWENVCKIQDSLSLSLNRNWIHWSQKSTIQWI